MKDMQVYIPTMGRLDKQPTWDALKAAGVGALLVCPLEEAAEHVKRGREVLCPPLATLGIAATRQWLLGAVNNPFVVMMDDDLTFAARRVDDPTKFRTVGDAGIQSMIASLHNLFNRGYAHVSIAMREGANRDTSAVREACRVARVIGYNREIFLRSGADFTKSTVMDDFEVTLFLLCRGFANGVLNNWVQNQGSSGAPGGASLYRTLEMQRKAAETLAARYPAFVKTVEKTTKTAWGGATRTDVIVQWKEALKHGRNLHGGTA